MSATAMCRCDNAWVSFDEYIICERGLKEEIAKVFGSREGESRVTRPQNIKTPSASAAPATRLVLSRARKTLSCDMSYKHMHIKYILWENENKMCPYTETIVASKRNSKIYILYIHDTPLNISRDIPAVEYDINIYDVIRVGAYNNIL